MRHFARGFSLIELMIVVAIVAVLSAVAVPQYQDYLTRARWSVNLTQIEPFKLAVAECLQLEGGLAGACDSAEKIGLTALPSPQHSTGELTLASSGDDTIIATMTGNAKAGDCVVTLTGTLTDDVLTWGLANTDNGVDPACTRQRTGV
ncbi:type IV pilus assembly protein PilA [Paraperlucidibaca baekdonensis]|uniref:Type IV pilus assembly protein PilA n=1 Tax=Paraperlucidibaca baekdonensis TaxID=748120 RepID=A0A3E0H5H4_9GAMM|nr:prepilin-type N-terminal cleavage/methylation domain-containing protein [Paraperlucidibaca baekdonensis]REH38791.1 type IV pilus assembly protein PilA [Paraperlucidibaca baekdonensis]